MEIFSNVAIILCMHFTAVVLEICVLMFSFEASRHQGCTKVKLKKVRAVNQ